MSSLFRYENCDIQVLRERSLFCLLSSVSDPKSYEYLCLCRWFRNKPLTGTTTLLSWVFLVRLSFWSLGRSSLTFCTSHYTLKYSCPEPNIIRQLLIYTYNNKSQEPVFYSVPGQKYPDWSTVCLKCKVQRKRPTLERENSNSEYQSIFTHLSHVGVTCKGTGSMIRCHGEFTIKHTDFYVFILIGPFIMMS